MKAATGLLYRDFQYVGMNGVLGAFCDDLQYYGDSTNTITDFRNAKGIFESHNTSAAIDIYTSVLASLWPKVLKKKDYPPTGATLDQYEKNTDCGRYQDTCKALINRWSWVYQSCIEFGTLIPSIIAVESPGKLTFTRRLPNREHLPPNQPHLQIRKH